MGGRVGSSVGEKVDEISSKTLFSITSAFALLGFELFFAADFEVGSTVGSIDGDSVGKVVDITDGIFDLVGFTVFLATGFNVGKTEDSKVGPVDGTSVGDELVGLTVDE